MSSSLSSFISCPSPVKTALSERIGLRYPLVSAPMFLISNPAMLISSAESGILGAMPSLNARTHEDFEQALGHCFGPYKVHFLNNYIHRKCIVNLESFPLNESNQPIVSF